MVNELNNHINKGQRSLIPISQVPGNTKILDLWSIKIKREIINRKIHRWETILNVHGGQHGKDVNYNSTYSPFIDWLSIKMLLVM